MAITLTIRDEEFKRHLRQATVTGLKRAAAQLQRFCVQAVNDSNKNRRVRTVKEFVMHDWGFSTQRSRRTVYDNMHNRWAGFSPFKRTGHGQANIVWEYNGDDKSPRVRVGVKKNAIYMIYLELGTRSIRARPWLLRMLKHHRAMLGQLACTGGKQ